MHQYYYISKDIERALAALPPQGNGCIIANQTDFAKVIKDTAQSGSVFLIENENGQGSTQLLLQSEKVKEILEKKPLPILVFKNTKKIEKICSENGWKLLNPSAELAQKVEHKLTQVKWLGELGKLLPECELMTVSELKFEGTPFIIQFGHSHTGSGTIEITSEKQIEALKEKFTRRELRKLKKVDGDVYTMNAVVHSDGILCGGISYQITGLEKFTKSKFATVGNDWGAASEWLSDDQKKEINSIAKKVGEKLRIDGWKGAFGIDVIVDRESGKVYFLEINARQPASVTYESKLQVSSDNTSSGECISIFEAHICALLGVNLSSTKIISTPSSSQIVVRTNDERKKIDSGIMEVLSSLGLEYFYTPGGDNDSDLLRIMPKEPLMSSPNKLNELGNKISELL